MISRLNNNNSSFQSADGIDSEQESIKSAPSDSDKTGLITEIGMPAADATNSPQQELYRDQWSTENPHQATKSSLIDVLVSQAKPTEHSDNASNIKEPTTIGIPQHLKSEKKEP